MAHFQFNDLISRQCIDAHKCGMKQEIGLQYHVSNKDIGLSTINIKQTCQS